MGAADFTPQLSARSAEIRGIVEGAAAAKRALNAAERASIVAMLRTLEALLTSRRDTLEKLKPRTVDFIRLISRDYAALATGSERIDEAIPAVERATTNAALKYMTPESQGLMRMVIEAGAKIRNKLLALSVSVHRLATANDDAQRAHAGRAHDVDDGRREVQERHQRALRRGEGGGRVRGPPAAARDRR